MATQDAQVKVSVRDMEPVRQVLAAAAGREDALRELLSYCEVEAARKAYNQSSAVKALAYADIRDKLRGVLDGES